MQFAPGSVPEPTLAVAGGGQIHRVPVGGILEIGRDPQCAIVLDSMAVSRVHARIRGAGTALVIEDLASRNGVYVNAARITAPTVLRLGDRITIGDRMLAITAAHRCRHSTQTARVNRNGAGSGPQPTVIHALITAVQAATAEGRLPEATSGLALLCDTVASTPDPRAMAPGIVDDVTGEILRVVRATQDPKWLEQLFRLRHRSEAPLDPRITEDLAERITEMPAAPDEERRAYVCWLQKQPLRFTERIALKHLAEARGR
jgi:hypothetical protein